MDINTKGIVQRLVAQDQRKQVQQQADQKEAAEQGERRAYLHQHYKEFLASLLAELKTVLVEANKHLPPHLQFDHGQVNTYKSGSVTYSADAGLTAFYFYSPDNTEGDFASFCVWRLYGTRAMPQDLHEISPDMTFRLCPIRNNLGQLALTWFDRQNKEVSANAIANAVIDAFVSQA